MSSVRILLAELTGLQVCWKGRCWITFSIIWTSCKIITTKDTLQSHHSLDDKNTSQYPNADSGRSEKYAIVPSGSKYKANCVGICNVLDTQSDQPGLHHTFQVQAGITDTTNVYFHAGFLHLSLMKGVFSRSAVV